MFYFIVLQCLNIKHSPSFPPQPSYLSKVNVSGGYAITSEVPVLDCTNQIIRMVLERLGWRADPFEGQGELGLELIGGRGS